jgi:nicotinate-nucleotide adenylyltransferase
MKEKILTLLRGGDDLHAPPPAGRMLYGGSFNPVHLGHLALIRHVMEQELARSLWIVPAGRSPFKGTAEYAPAEHRLKMLELALQTLPEELLKSITISDAELRRPGPSYTAETLQALDDGVDTALLIGADSLEFFDQWRQADWILTRVPLYVAFRSGIDEAQVKYWRRRLQGFFPVARIYLIPFTPPDCSSTRIRNALASSAGFAELRECLPQSVFAYIRHAGLYRRDV